MAVKRYIGILNNPRFRSKVGKSQFQIWSDMVDLLVAHAREVDTGESTGIDVEMIIRSGFNDLPIREGSYGPA
jgi:pre-mRNA-splicing factor SYF1